MDVAQDGTVWIASIDAILRLGTDGLIAVHADPSTMVPDGTASALVGSRGSSSSIVSLTVAGDSLLFIDAWSNRLLRLHGQRLMLVAGRPEEQRASCPDPVLDDALSPAQVCAGSLVKSQAAGVYVSQYQGIVTLPASLLDAP